MATHDLFRRHGHDPRAPEATARFVIVDEEGGCVGGWHQPQKQRNPRTRGFKGFRCLAISQLWSWGESNPRPLRSHRTRYDHSRDSGFAVAWLPGQREPCGSSAWSFPGVSGLCLPSMVSPIVHHCFCCRAAVIGPRVASRLAMFLWLPKKLGGESEVSLVGASVEPRLTSLSNSGRTHDFSSQRRNRSAPR